MFLDASVIVTVIAREAGYETFEEKLTEHVGPFYVSALAYYEAAQGIARIAAAGLKPSANQLAEAGKSVDDLLGSPDVRFVELTAEIGRLAITASATYGKAVSHPAALNMGDCFAYACAKSLNVPLLYKGEDFAKTDLA
jgi:ribonuclease VapC